MEPNPEEVAATRYVTEAELAAMMAPGSGLAWSPWFRIIARNFLSRSAAVPDKPPTSCHAFEIPPPRYLRLNTVRQKVGTYTCALSLSRHASVQCA